MRTGKIDMKRGWEVCPDTITLTPITIRGRVFVAPYIQAVTGEASSLSVVTKVCRPLVKKHQVPRIPQTGGELRS